MKNVLGKELKLCCKDPLTGYFRDGLCRTDVTDRGTHVVCAVMTNEFLSFTKSMGNDLSTPRPDFNFPGLKRVIVGACASLDGNKHMTIM